MESSIDIKAMYIGYNPTTAVQWLMYYLATEFDIVNYTQRGIEYIDRGNGVSLLLNTYDYTATVTSDDLEKCLDAQKVCVVGLWWLNYAACEASAMLTEKNKCCGRVDLSQLSKECVYDCKVKTGYQMATSSIEVHILHASIFEFVSDIQRSMYIIKSLGCDTQRILLTVYLSDEGGDGTSMTLYVDGVRGFVSYLVNKFVCAHPVLQECVLDAMIHCCNPKRRVYDV